MREVTVAATQMSCLETREKTIEKADRLVREAAENGANIILLQELFETPYFCQLHKFEYLDLSTTLEENPAVCHFKKVAKELDAVIPVSFYERTGNTAFNSVAIIDATGEVLGVYRKTHIPDGVPYAEKFYFTPGDTGFKVWETKYANIGVGICWDQWFPEAARCMALSGAEILLYPTAIGTEPKLKIDSSAHWRNTMAGHAAANMMPVVASNRIGVETEDDSSMSFYGKSFIADNHGEILSEADDKTEQVIYAKFDLDKFKRERREWGIFRDRRPEMYDVIMTHGR
ncbi:MAG: N-carbamoylputrescine amidase [Lachnospiraceae bacterium]|nr:N-carbamoylputrescine amidase [Lachnospiraceae bacterium]